MSAVPRNHFRRYPGDGEVPLLRRLIGAVLRRIRLGQGRTLSDVARAAGVSVPYLSELERGRKEPSSEVLASICRALGLHLADLLGEVREELLHLAPRRVPTGRPPTQPRAGTGGPSGRRRPRCRPALRVALSADFPRAESGVRAPLPEGSFPGRFAG